MAQDSEGHQYTTASWERRLVSRYTGLSFLEVADLNYLQYLIWRRDAFIDWLNQSESGREYLDNAYRMEQTQPDRKRLRETFGKEGN
jgi:hypothetical protein